MQIFRNLEDVPSNFGPTVVSVGNYDGVHRAHQEVVRHMAERARTFGGKAVVVTFEPHPLRILRPNVAPELLTPLAGKLRCWSRLALTPSWRCRSPAICR